MPLMTALTVALIVLGFRRKGDGRLNRIAGAILLAIYVGYLALLVIQAKG
jgi:cation:H+ antiporter